MRARAALRLAGRSRTGRSLAGLLACAGVVLACAGCAGTKPPAALGHVVAGPILNVVTASKLIDGRPRGLHEVFPAQSDVVIGAVLLGKVGGPAQLTMTWSRVTAAGAQPLFSKQLTVGNFGLAYTIAASPAGLPLGTYRVTATVDGQTKSANWTVYTPADATTVSDNHQASVLRLAGSGVTPERPLRPACQEIDSLTSMPSTTTVHLDMSTFCPQRWSDTPVRGIILATMDRAAGAWYVGALHHQQDGMLTGDMALNLCSLPGGTNVPGTSVFYDVIIYYRGETKSFDYAYVLPAARVAPVVFISSSVPPGTLVHPGQKITLRVTAAEPTSIGPQVAVRSIVVSGPGGVLRSAHYPKGEKHACGTSRLSKTITVTYTVPAGAGKVVTLTATAGGAVDLYGTRSVSFPVGS